MAENENRDIKEIDYIQKVLKEKEINPRALNEITLGNTPENLEKFDKCTLEEHYCGFKTKDCFCLKEDRCFYKLSEKYFQKLTEKPTVEIILELLAKGKIKTINDILAITPKNEIISEIVFNSENKPISKLYIVDVKGNIFDIQKLRVIRRKY